MQPRAIFRLTRIKCCEFNVQQWLSPYDIDPIHPEGAGAELFDLCAQPPAPCPECSDGHYVILASVTLPLSEGDPITAGNIMMGSAPIR